MNPSAANSGSWQHNEDGTYTARLVEFTYDPTTHGVTQIVTPTIVYSLDGSDRLHSISATTTIYLYNPATGQQVAPPIVLANVSVSEGFRFTTQWTPQNPLPTGPFTTP